MINPNDDTKKDLKQKENEQKLVQRILNHFSESRVIKAEEEKAWKRQEDFYQSKQWKSKPQYQGQLQPVTNICFSLVESIVPQLTDNRPQMVCLPTESEDEQSAEILTNIIEYIWDARDMDYKLILNERTRIKHGMGIYKVFWNPDLLKGLGDIDIIPVPLDQFFISPRAKSVQDSDYVIYGSLKTTEYIEKKYGKKVQSDKKYDEISVFDETDDSPRQDNKVLLLEYWTKENGKLRLITIAGETVLRDEVEFYKHGKYPFVAIPAFPVEKKFWAMGILSQIISPQMIVNLLDQQILDNARLAGNTTIFNGAGSGLNKHQLHNQPVNIVDVNDPNMVKKEPGVQIPSFIANHLEIKKRDAELVSGIHDVTQGRSRGTVTAASAILALQESANQRIRLLGRTLEAGLKEVGELIIDLVKEYYTEERTIRILGDNFKTKFIKFKSDSIKRTREYDVFNEESMKMEKEIVEIDPDFDIRVEVGSSMQYSKAFLYEQSKELFQMGVIDAQALLETVRFPKADEVLSRLQQQQQMMQPTKQSIPQQPTQLPTLEEFYSGAPDELKVEIDNMINKGMSEEEIMNTLTQLTPQTM